MRAVRTPFGCQSRSSPTSASTAPPAPSARSCAKFLRTAAPTPPGTSHWWADISIRHPFCCGSASPPPTRNTCLRGPVWMSQRQLSPVRPGHRGWMRSWRYWKRASAGRSGTTTATT
ncbi:hypothetical protein ADL03_06735 [Nocardia sp. NRRL S-836]|nr:hypothetical protein ADL03_06735 [Nocardia sp. NRRL S-836]